MSIELVPLVTAKLKPRNPTFVGDVGTGTRLVVEIESAVWRGDRLNAEQLGTAAADWPLVTAGGVGFIDVRTTLKTDDGAIIYVYYHGRAVTGPEGPTIYCSPLFETSAPQYTWLNGVQAVAKGTIDSDGFLTYEIFEVR